MKQQWRQEQQQAFNKLKQVFTTRPVLAVLDLDKEFRIEVDTSNYATREILSMRCSNELQRPVAFISKSLSDIERNYETHDKEMLAIVKYKDTFSKKQQLNLRSRQIIRILL